MECQPTMYRGSRLVKTDPVCPSGRGQVSTKSLRSCVNREARQAANHFLTPTLYAPKALTRLFLPKTPGDMTHPLPL
jgi:hypothetical protein